MQSVRGPPMPLGLSQPPASALGCFRSNSATPERQRRPRQGVPGGPWLQERDATSLRGWAQVGVKTSLVQLGPTCAGEGGCTLVRAAAQQARSEAPPAPAAFRSEPGPSGASPAYGASMHACGVHACVGEGPGRCAQAARLPRGGAPAFKTRQLYMQWCVQCGTVAAASMCERGSAARHAERITQSIKLYRSVPGDMGGCLQDSWAGSVRQAAAICAEREEAAADGTEHPLPRRWAGSAALPVSQEARR